MAVRIGNLDPHTAATIITYGILLATILMPITAIIADKTNGYKMCLWGLLLAVIFSPIMMHCAQSGDPTITLIGQLIYAIIDALVSATLFTILLKHFQTGTKYSGSSIAWSITTAVFGGSTLMVDELLTSHFHQLNGPGIYISISALICLIIVFFTTTASRKIISKQLA